MTTINFGDKPLIFIEGEPTETEIITHLNNNKQLLKPFSHLFGFMVDDLTKIDNETPQQVWVMDMLNMSIENYVILDIERVKTIKI